MGKGPGSVSWNESVSLKANIYTGGVPRGPAGWLGSRPGLVCAGGEQRRGLYEVRVQA